MKTVTYAELEPIGNKLSELADASPDDKAAEEEYWPLQEQFKPMLELALHEHNLVKFTKPELFQLMLWIGTHRPVPLHTVFSSFSLALKAGLPDETIELEVCERLGDPGKFHACRKGNTGVWGAGSHPADAIGSVIMSHPEKFGLKVTLLEGKHAR